MIGFGSERLVEPKDKRVTEEYDELTIVERLGQKAQTQIPRCQKLF